MPLLGLHEDDFELLEADQLSVQTMMASHFADQFRTEVEQWHGDLTLIADAFQLITDVQHTWSYLEPLFMSSDEVKQELPDDTERFQQIDETVRKTLRDASETKIVKTACIKDGLVKTLTAVREKLDVCKKSLKDYLDGKQRQAGCEAWLDSLGRCFAIDA